MKSEVASEKFIWSFFVRIQSLYISHFFQGFLKGWPLAHLYIWNTRLFGCHFVCLEGWPLELYTLKTGLLYTSQAGLLYTWKANLLCTLKVASYIPGRLASCIPGSPASCISGRLTYYVPGRLASCIPGRLASCIPEWLIPCKPGGLASCIPGRLASFTWMTDPLYTWRAWYISGRLSSCTWKEGLCRQTWNCFWSWGKILTSPTLASASNWSPDISSSG